MSFLARTRGVITPLYNLNRSYATHANGYLPAVLHLKTGQSFKGQSFGAPRSIFGETVFSTSITSYTESMTDPSYRGQILVFTTPLIGNYGVPHNQTPVDSYDVGVILESKGIQCAGVIVATLRPLLSPSGPVTRLLRDQGTTLGRIAIGSDAGLPAPQAADYWDPSKENLVDQVSTREPYVLNPSGDIKIAVLDFGQGQYRSITCSSGRIVTVFPWNYDFNKVRNEYDGLFLSNGPGDPMHCMEAAMKLRTTIQEWDRPIFGICMGHQVIGIAAGLEAYRMTFGNRGHNQPVLALANSGSIKAGRVYVTRYAFISFVEALQLSLFPTLQPKPPIRINASRPLPQGWEPFFINCNDSSVEGIKSTSESGKQVWGVQFHPESAGGPLDTIEMFTDFVNTCRAGKESRTT
ncbi:Carbamoyl-phosphate synthase small chain [Rhizoctonia solani]|uniref:Carbamoyl-phosphate synthase small chain n=1 Tax=Rhizoctonia solani TaxID=456999 RepID=A0A8H7IFP9_9AGAM|nr:Carbamoyl-phosphate synthase small chain [Rhizoctonia solani]